MIFNSVVSQSVSFYVHEQPNKQQKSTTRSSTKKALVDRKPIKNFPAWLVKRKNLYTKMASFRNVLITGCNKGIGLEFVKQFLNLPQPPQNLFATCRSPKPETAPELVKLAENNSNLHLLKLDVTNNDDISRVAKDVEKVLQDDGLNLLINNAGVYARVGLQDVTVDQMMETFRANAVGPLMIVQALLPYLKQAAKSTSNSSKCKAAIVNISAKTASVTDNQMGKLYPSRASKAALNIITKSLSVDLKDDGISAIVMNPGWVKTPNGGPGALITTEESVIGMLNVIDALDLTKSGMFFNYNGDSIPW